MIEEIEAADALLVGAPMYNLSVPSNLKAWIDNVVVIGHTVMGAAMVKGKHVIDFIVPELTLAPVDPAMHHLIPLFEASRDRVHEEAALARREPHARVAPTVVRRPGPQIQVGT
ncbi:NAD(P)H-dependent oxidoreductase [Streptomyces sp. NPDC050743]|uniref:NAD(P)H-dependent oxidoreductase n=1 Tax=Streptomyces sp. NPDC050743 TaxID=3365634 RepID=UPI00379BC1F9